MAQLVRDDNGDTYAVKEDDVQDVNPPKYYQVFSEFLSKIFHLRQLL